MSVGPSSGILGSAAGAPLAQTKGNETTRASQQGSAQQRQLQNEKAADDAAGVGQTQEDQGASERDADGRRLWERAPERHDAETHPEETESAHEPPKVSDPKGEAGGQLDLSG
ncbi:MAG: hypothetical protein KDA42_10425 [Planctomycetales bacterium]|nr:hypothetical protein [Planctomycetales bacterium]